MAEGTQDGSEYFGNLPEFISSSVHLSELWFNVTNNILKPHPIRPKKTSRISQNTHQPIRGLDHHLVRNKASTHSPHPRTPERKGDQIII
ncbi:MAG: hypothetical protein Q9212_003151 [Teloschistes hypoglaucus]